MDSLESVLELCVCELVERVEVRADGALVGFSRS